MKKKKIYTVSEFSNVKEEAIKTFLHHALDHMRAANYLNKKTLLLDSAAYLCNIAFEVLFKAWHLYKFDKFEASHDILDLSKGIDLLSKKDKALLKLIDQWNLIRYPIDIETYTKKQALQIGKMSYYAGEIGTHELENASKLFEKIWGKLEKKSDFKNLISAILKNPHKKGNRIVMSKKMN